MASRPLHAVRLVAPPFTSLLLLLSAACGGRQSTPPIERIDAQVVGLQWGRLVDIYGFRRAADGALLSEVVAADQLVGTDIGTDGTLQFADGTRFDDAFSVLSADADTLQPRLLIKRVVGTTDFARILDRLDDGVREVTNARFGQDATRQPFPMVPRNAALRVQFDRDLGVGAEFFYSLDAERRIIGVRNTEAVQMLAILADPDDAVDDSAFRQLPFRVAVQGSALVLDPVLLGTEADRLQSRSTARGLPASPDQRGANLRLAIALEGPLALPSVARRLRETANVGTNANGSRSLIFDFRTGHPDDDTPFVARGFVRDPTPPRLVGEIPLLLESVQTIDDARQLVTLYKNGIDHRVDAGDALRLETDAGVLARTEVLAVNGDSKLSQHVLLVVRREAALATADPSTLPGYPREPSAREEFLRAHPVRMMLVAEFEQGDGGTGGDDPHLFVTVSPRPEGERVVVDGVVDHVSPYAGVVLRFSKSIDLDSVKPLETMFLATRRLLDADYADFIEQLGADRTRLTVDKFATPHLVVSELRDGNGAQSVLILQTPFGFYFDASMREAPRSLRTYWLHLVSGRDGVRDFAGNGLDLQPGLEVRDRKFAVGLSLDVRIGNDGRPRFADNRVINLARRCNSLDEDEQPSIYRAAEIPLAEEPAPNPRAFPLDDLFGAVVYLNGRLSARPTSRASSFADDRNQPPPPTLNSDLSWCPVGQLHAPTASTRFTAPIQNPVNPYGCRLQTVWREIDLGLSRLDPNDFDLDVEAMHWAPFQARAISFDELDSVTISLGHSEQRPEPCVDIDSSLPPAIDSGLVQRFRDNYAFDFAAVGGRESDPRRNAPPHSACRREPMLIDRSLATLDPSGLNRYLPLPTFSKPHFVWRDQTKLHQGGNSRVSSDIDLRRQWLSYIPSPFLGGQGRYATVDAAGRLRTNLGFWRNGQNINLANFTEDPLTGGLLGPIALPLLADFEIVPDEPDLPMGRGSIALGTNGWQVSLTVQSWPQPDFRVYSAGGVDPGGTRYIVAPGQPSWDVAAGGRDPLLGVPTPPGDNTLYWLRADFLRRRTVATAGFVDLLDPHRMPAGSTIDPRLGPYVADVSAGASLPAGLRPRYASVLSPGREALPAGTSVRVEFRAAGIVDPAPWVARADGRTTRWTASGQEAPDADNFPLDPRKAGDAHIRKFNNAAVEGSPWRHWIGLYNRLVTDYVDDPARLHDPEWLRQFGPTNRPMQPRDVRYVSWRLVFENNVDVQPAVSPSLESYGVVYRLETR